VLSAEYLAENRKEIIATKRVQYAANKVREIARVRSYQKANPEKLTAWWAKRRSSRLNATPAWLTPEHHAEITTIYAQAAHQGWHVDHIVPLQGKRVCGLHVPWNLTILSPCENMAKGNRFDPELGADARSSRLLASPYGADGEE
jgi:5-methylcytosine-specific restriction endonuclease McrA